jgi:hypothetical protein
MLLKKFHKIERKGMLLNSSYDVNITANPKPKKSQTNFLDEHRHKNSQ